MRFSAGSYVAVSVAGAIHAVRRSRHARFLGIQLPGTPLQHAMTIGSPLSAPPAMQVALLAAVRPTVPQPVRHRWVRWLAVMFLVGIVGEVDTRTTLLHPTGDRFAAVVLLLEVVLPVSLLWSAR